ncbi:glutathione S-transferase family protein [Caulobacter sp. 602-1]|uniref:glutathione S-transferase family protein n=1 Tax=Caulobacter sp. 602-1 TaxID=2492472 RepID=UPI000F63E0CC|nr:glutathione S-transferase family protein [Caulobacter sp. 602-1]RRN65131.1 glutathione S-transferase family protein [Caulobacter sp. 602-1]
MELISLPVSPFAARVRIAIYAKGLPIDLVPPPADWRESRRFRDLSPTGRIPVLLDDRGPIWESAVLLDYLEERFPEAPTLMPVDAFDRAMARLLVRHVDLYLMPPMVVLARPGVEDANARRAVEDLLDGVAMLDGLLKGPRYALCDRLTIADCALAPALFAIRVTAERLGMDLIEAGSLTETYSRLSGRDPHVGRVIEEMEEGLRHLVRLG